MLIKKIWHFLLGYIVIKVEGLSLEKYMNLVALNNIKMWNVKRTSHKTLIASMGIKDFKNLRKIQKKVRCNIKIIDKRGLPFIIHRYKRRKALTLGMFAFLISIYAISAFIWIVEVEDLDNVDADIVKERIAEFGIAPGQFKGNIDISNVENKMMIEFPEISWISVELKGTRAIVRIVEAVSPPEGIDVEGACNIVASKAGIIHKMIVLEGIPTVEENDMVEPGQLLVSGIIDHSDTTGIRYVHARGEILARTWYEVVDEVKIEDFSYRPTGNVVECKYIGLGQYIMDFIVQPITFERYEVVERKELFFGEGKFIPLEFIVREYHELEAIPKNLVLERAKEAARELASAQIDRSIPHNAKIIDKTYKYDIIEGERVLCTLYIEVIEDIGIQQKIAYGGEDMIIEQPDDREAD